MLIDKVFLPNVILTFLKKWHCKGQIQYNSCAIVTKENEEDVYYDGHRLCQWEAAHWACL
jgi:hypothetical protein